MKQESKNKEFNEKFLGSYQQEQSDPPTRTISLTARKLRLMVRLRPLLRMLPPLPKNWQQM